MSDYSPFLRLKNRPVVEKVEKVRLSPNKGREIFMVERPLSPVYILSQDPFNPCAADVARLREAERGAPDLDGEAFMVTVGDPEDDDNEDEETNQHMISISELMPTAPGDDGFLTAKDYERLLDDAGTAIEGGNTDMIKPPKEQPKPRGWLTADEFLSQSNQSDIIKLLDGETAVGVGVVTILEDTKVCVFCNKPITPQDALVTTADGHTRHGLCLPGGVI